MSSYLDSGVILNMSRHCDTFIHFLKSRHLKSDFLQFKAKTQFQSSYKTASFARSCSIENIRRICTCRCMGVPKISLKCKLIIHLRHCFNISFPSSDLAYFLPVLPQLKLLKLNYYLWKNMLVSNKPI